MVDQVLAAAINVTGSAVAHCAAGLELFELQVSAKYRWFSRLSRGRVEMPTKIDDNRLAGYLIALWAGEEAEAEWLTRYHGHNLGTARREIERAGDSADNRDAFAEFSPVIGMTQTEARASARSVVLTYWPLIEELAAQLARDGRLPGSAVAERLSIPGRGPVQNQSQVRKG